jgi:hypothetical protein
MVTKRLANHNKLSIIVVVLAPYRCPRSHVSLIDGRDFVLQVCDEPHPLLIKDMLDHCIKADIDEAYKAGSCALSIIFIFVGNVLVMLWILKA